MPSPCQDSASDEEPTIGEHQPPKPRRARDYNLGSNPTIRNSRSPHPEPQRNAKSAYLCATRFWKSCILTKRLTGASVTATSTVLNPSGIPSAQSLPRMAASPSPTASNKDAAVTSAVCATPFASVRVTRHGRVAIAGIVHDFASYPLLPPVCHAPL
jgi:hypothetical protein